MEARGNCGGAAGLESGRCEGYKGLAAGGGGVGKGKNRLPVVGSQLSPGIIGTHPIFSLSNLVVLSIPTLPQPSHSFQAYHIDPALNGTSQFVAASIRGISLARSMAGGGGESKRIERLSVGGSWQSVGAGVGDQEDTQRARRFCSIPVVARASCPCPAPRGARQVRAKRGQSLPPDNRDAPYFLLVQSGISLDPYTSTAVPLVSGLPHRSGP